MPQAATHTEIDINGSKIDFYVDSFSEWTDILVSNRNATKSILWLKNKVEKKKAFITFFLTAEKESGIKESMIERGATSPINLKKNESLSHFP